MSKNILVIGMGRLGRHLAIDMQNLGNDVMIVDKHEEQIEELAPLFTDSFCGDCTKEGVLRSLGVNNFDVVFVTIGENFQSSLEITAMLKDLNAKRVVSKAKRDSQARFLINVGADEVIYPERETAEKLAIRYNAENIFDSIELTEEYAIYEVATPPGWVGKTIAGLNVRQAHHVDVIAIKKGEVLQPMPGGDYVFANDDILVVLGKSADVFRLSREKNKGYTG